MGKKIVVLRGDKPISGGLGLSSIFGKKGMSMQISAQIIERLARQEEMYVALVRPSFKDKGKEEDRQFKELSAIVELEDAKIETPFPREMKEILVEYSNVLPRELPAGLPPKRAMNHKIELLPRTE